MLRTRPIAFAFSVLCSLLPGASAATDGTSPPLEVRDSSTLEGAARTSIPSLFVTSFDFDAPNGSADPQGWASEAVQPAPVNHWRVQGPVTVPSFAGFLTSRAMWCGVRATESPEDWVVPAGYGNEWDEVLESQEFTTSGTLALQFSTAYDIEQLEDFLYVETLIGNASEWQVAAEYSGESLPAISESVTLALGLDSTPVRVRFRFVSNETGSSADGLFITQGGVSIDDIRLLSSVDGIVASEDFEGSNIDAGASADGFWFAPPPTEIPIGDRSALVSGSGVRQEGTTPRNDTNFWSWFQGSADTYRCDQDPTQLAVPTTTNPADPNVENTIDNRVISPWFSLDTGDPDQDGFAVLRVEAALYLDLEFDDGVYYSPEVRFGVDGVRETAWTREPFVYFGPAREWTSRAFRWTIPEGATEAQITWRVQDLGYAFGFASDCHSHGPLIDDVVVTRVPEDDFVVTSTANSGPGSLRAAIEGVNLSPLSSSIRFDLPTGDRVIGITTSLPAFTVPVVIDGTTEFEYEDVPIVRIDRVGSNPFQNPAGLNLAGDSVVRGLHITDFSRGLTLRGSNNLIEASWIQRGARGVVVDAAAGVGHRLRDNLIWDMSSSGIDLGDDGPTANDPLDADTGPNELQNHPVVTSVIGPTGRIALELDSAPNTSYTIDVFRGRSCASNGRGHGEELLESLDVTTDATGRASAQVTTGVGLATGDFVSALATDPNGNTSEFAPCVFVDPVFLVTNTNDSGPGSFREQLVFSGGFIDVVPRILFDIPGEGPHVIPITSPLPTIFRQVEIDATTQTGWTANTAPAPLPLNGRIAVALDGSGLTSSSPGLDVRARRTVVRGLAIGGFGGAGIRIDAPEVVVEGCAIGTDASAEVAVPNADDGVRILEEFVQGFDTRIGGNLPSQRNVIAGNGGAGIRVDERLSIVEGNVIGASASLLPLGNASHGILVESNFSDIGVGTGNLLAYNGGAGLRSEDSMGADHRWPRNVYRENAGLGIDRASDGPTLGIGDNGFSPEIVDADPVADSITLASVDSDADSVFVYVSSVCDPSGFGEGERLVAALATPTVTDPMVLPLGFDLEGGEILTAIVEIVGDGVSEFGNCFEVINTPVGVNVAVDAAGSGGAVQVVFDEVISSGITRATVIDDPPAAPSGLVFGAVDVTDLTTSAIVSGAIEVCRDFDPSDLGGAAADVVLLHFVAGIWIDITTTRDPIAGRVCGTTTTLSPFAVATSDLATGVTPVASWRRDLGANVPNPFNPRTEIAFTLEARQAVRLEVLDLSGRRVRTLVAGTLDAGEHRRVWDGRDDSGRGVASGVYLYRVATDHWTATRKMALVR